MRLVATTSSPRRGAAAAEMVILLPFLGVMFTATLDFCRIYAAAQALRNSAQVAALYASGTVSNPNAASTQEAAQNAAVAECPTLNPPLSASNVTVTTSSSQVVVTIAYDFPMLTPFLGNSGATTIRRSVTMNVAPGGP